MSTAEHIKQTHLKEKNVFAEAGKTIQSTVDIGSDLLCRWLDELLTKFVGKSSATLSDDELHKIRSIADRLEFRAKKLSEYCAEIGAGQGVIEFSMDELKALCAELNSEIEVYHRLHSRFLEMKCINQDDINELRSLSDRLSKFEDLKRRADTVVQHFRLKTGRGPALENPPSDLEREEAKLIQSTLDFAVLRVNQLRLKLKELVGSSKTDVRLPENLLRDINSIADKIKTRATKLDILEARLSNDPLFVNNKQDIQALCEEIMREAEVYQTLKEKLMEIGAVGRDHVAVLDELYQRMSKFEDLKHRAVMIAGYKQIQRPPAESKYL